MSSKRRALGARGEEAVAALLRGRGFVVLGQNVRVGRLELDLIARRGDLLVVCEVRTRRSEAFGHPVETIGPEKVARVRRATAQWIAEREDLGRVQIRFDAAGVLIPHDGAEPQIDYYADAF